MASLQWMWHEYKGVSNIINFYVAGVTGLARELLHDLSDSLPGLDEAKSFIQVMGYVLVYLWF